MRFVACYTIRESASHLNSLSNSSSFEPMAARELTHIGASEGGEVGTADTEEKRVR